MEGSRPIQGILASEDINYLDFLTYLYFLPYKSKPRITEMNPNIICLCDVSLIINFTGWGRLPRIDKSGETPKAREKVYFYNISSSCDPVYGGGSLRYQVQKVIVPGNTSNHSDEVLESATNWLISWS